MGPNKRAGHKNKKIRILFADNDPDFLDTRAEFVERAGFLVVKANSLTEANRYLTEEWAPIAILDVRMENDDDEKDISGLILAKQGFHNAVYKIILTNFPSYVHLALYGISPTADFLGKQEGPQVLIDAIEIAVSEKICFNWDLLIDWKARDCISLVNLIFPAISVEHILTRAEELDNLFRRLFYEKDHIRIEQLLWQREGRIALVVFAFKEGQRPESFVAVSGQASIVREEAKGFEEFSPKAPGASSTILSDRMRTETTHFAANAYSLTGNDLEKVQTLAELFRLGSDKNFNAVLTHLYQETLKVWHQGKLIREKKNTLESLYTERLYLKDKLARELLEERINLIEAEIPTLGTRIERSEERLTFHFSDQSFTYPDPLELLYKPKGTMQPLLLVTVPGMLSGENILTDGSGRAWLTDFAEAGLAPLSWNYVTLEAAIRYDWVETRELIRRHELEYSLIFSDFARPNIRDLEPVVRKPGRAIETIRKLAARTVGIDHLAYHLGLYFHAARRLVDFDPASPMTSNELARMGHILLSMAMLAEVLYKGQETPSQQKLDIPELSIPDLKSHTVLKGSQPLHFTPQQFEVIRQLYENAGKICTKEELVAKALAGKYDEGYLHTLIGRIRKELEDDPEQPRYLITERNVGYRLYKKPG